MIPLLGLVSEPDQPGRVRNNGRQLLHLEGWCEVTSGPACRGLLFYQALGNGEPGIALETMSVQLLNHGDSP